MTTLSSNRASTLWIILLTVTSTLASFALACMTPLAALAAVAAVHMRRRDGIVLILATWAVNQVVGFGWLHYPVDATTIAWGVGIGAASVAAVLGAEVAAQPRRGYAARVAMGYLGAFVAFKFVLLACSLLLGGVDTATSLEVIAPQFAREALFVVGLVALYRGAVALGVPAADPPRVALTA